MTQRHRCADCRKRGTFDELVKHGREEHEFPEIEMSYLAYYPHKTEQMELDMFG